MTRERRTLAAMIRLYCRRQHGTEKELCGACQELHEYSQSRLDHCPFQAGKTACGQCEVHCYKLTMRERICEVMRAVGPTMIWHHPLMALTHLLDGLRRHPEKR
jgi:hypothetical protein